MDLRTVSALDLARLVRARELSPVEVVEDFLARIERVNPQVGAFVAVRGDGARADARRLAEQVARGEDPGPLAGVPFTAKDLTATADLPMTLGSRAFEGFRPGVDAVVIERLRAAGAILMGTTNSPELGARPTTENDLHGATRNPWNPERTSGGSSGGAAAACASGLSPIAQGSDGGGSIRIPASCCGVYGLKPSRARISQGPLGGEGWAGLAVTGPITRTVSDAAAMLDATAGPSTGDPYWAPPPDRPFLSATAERPRLRIAVCPERDAVPTDPEVRAALEATAALLDGLGHAVEESPGPPVAAMEDEFTLITTACIGALPLTPEQRELLEPRTRLIFDTARGIPAPDYVLAIMRAHMLCRDAVAFFDRYDVLLTPTLNYPPPPVGAIGGDPRTAWSEFRLWHPFTWPFNVTGQPAASVPAGLSRDGLPIGVQIVGPPAGEHTVIALSAEIEEARPWGDRLPPVS